MSNAEILKNDINTAAILALWKNNSGLIYKSIYRWAGRGVPFDDLEQEAYIALDIAVKRYKRSGGKYAFSTVLTKSLNWYFIRYFRNQTHLNNKTLSLNAPIPNCEDGDAEFIDMLVADIHLEEDAIEDITKTEIYNLCIAAIRRLPKDYCEILTCRLIDGLNLERIAEIMGLTSEQAWHLYRIALRRLRADYKLKSALDKYQNI